MDIAVLFFSSSPKMIVNRKKLVGGNAPKLTCGSSDFSRHFRFDSREFRAGYPCTLKTHKISHEHLPPVCAILSDVEDVEVSSQLDDFSVTRSRVSDARELMISVEVFGARTKAIFESVFEKMVAAAQPIPGFRRVKGGKTPNIPRDILLEVLGPSKVYKQVIMEVINSTIAEYVEKEGLKVGKDLRVEQSFEDLEVTFEAGEKFSFDAVIQLQEAN
ncbi:trigger factor-like isoform X1 [Juglans microcarpa x Juglans regia]|uniref:trigger factor-like isoform X1 n=1 Tax=Juglans microcarpa x Juglans regia TaxID=2249226 RepID=UPI001B7EA573|nr:trigger factor-like isoform X1 [Juglans microcarpa x Juglans regia]XP_041001862.1 trigger factor-like isoform X1 [Juglans microcarpa x Juglans regia]XP_041001863.1 trigger factor-like isoform X1 [Juglans microcarpa x Juglans regia]